MGEVAAGKPTLATEDSSDHVSLGDLFRGTELFFLKVTGDSMSGDGILIGDYVVVDFDSRGRCEDGDMVVVSVNGEATVKRMWRDGNSFHLESSNPTYEPIIVEESEESLLLGKVVGVVRDHIKKGYHRRD
jgi:repressor LexA